jgi:arylsulfatase A
MTRFTWHLCLLIAVTCFFPLPGQTADARSPNFVIVYCDDQGYQDLGCFGSPNIKTPNVDQLAAEGIRFTDFYSAYCVCSASRASLLTGCYQPRISMRGVLGPHTRTALHPDEVTIADMLRSRGYATAMVGKWHVGDTPETLPTAQGFDSYFGIPYSNDMARMKGWGNNPADLDKIWSLKKWDIYNNELYRNKKIIESPVNQVTITDRYTAESLKFIRANKDRPFFLYLAQTMPHVPLFVSDDRYDADPHQAYRLTIEHIDWSVGQIMKTLDDLDLAENTFIVYTSDNGPWLSKKHHGGSALPLRAGKATTYEGGMRVPCVMRWPARIKPGQVCNQVAATIDLLPTFASIAGATLDTSRPIDGLDVCGLLDDPDSESPHEKTGFYYFRNNKLDAIRLGDWKLHFKTKLELYNLREDIGESKNQAEAESELVKQLTVVAERYHADLKAHTRPAWSAAARPAPGK